MRAFEYKTLFLEEILTEFEKTKQELIDLYNRLERIIQTSEHQGERDNASRLMNRVLKQLEDKYDWSSNKSNTQKTARQQYRTGGDPRYQAGAKAYQKTADSAFKVVFFGRYVDPMLGKRGSDKVWGWGVKNGYIYHFWGPTGKTPQVKRMDNNAFNLDASNRKALGKAAKGYKKMSAEASTDWIRQVLRRNPKFTESINEAYRNGIIDTWPRSVEEIFELAYSGGEYQIEDRFIKNNESMHVFLKHIPFENVKTENKTNAILIHPYYDFSVQVNANINSNKNHVFALTVIPQK